MLGSESTRESTRESRSDVEKRIDQGIDQGIDQRIDQGIEKRRREANREGESRRGVDQRVEKRVEKRCREAMSRSDVEKRCRCEEAMPRRSDAAHLLCPYLRKKEMKIYQNLSKKQYVRALEGTKKRLEFFFCAIFFSQVPQKETSCRSEISFLLRVLSKESKRR